jgi:dihydroflavonol-4-reductase
MSDDVFLTGATGFVGSYVLEALLAAGYQVRALVRGMPERWPERPGLKPVAGDLLYPGELVPALRGCRYLVHVAGCYSFAPRDRSLVRQVNVRGTAGLLEAARIAEVEKVVVTSSSATVGPAPSPHRPATEENRWNGSHHPGYHASKIEQEMAALAAQLPVVLVLPTAPIGAGDRRPTPTGKMVLDFMRGRISARVHGGMNLVPVQDVARGHLLALERGWPGERYLLGGENLSFDQIWSMLASISGQRFPRWRLPHPLMMGLAHLDDLRCRGLRGQPRVPLEGARMARFYMYAHSGKAAQQLGWWAGPAMEALTESVHWYRQQGLA